MFRHGKSSVNVEFGSRAQRRQHIATHESMADVRTSVLRLRDRVRQLKATLVDVGNVEPFGNVLVLNRSMLDNAPWSTSGISPDSIEVVLVMDFLQPKELVTASMVCRHWRNLSRSDHVWAKFLFSPVEQYPLRQLLHLEDERMYPAIQVYMVFRTSGIVQYPLLGATRTKSVHLSNSQGHASDATIPFRTWRAAKPTPLPPATLRAVCRQLLLACIACDDRKMPDLAISFDFLVMHCDTSSTEETGAVPVPLLQLTKCTLDNGGGIVTLRLQEDHRLVHSLAHHGGALERRVLVAFLHCALNILDGDEDTNNCLVWRCLDSRPTLDSVFRCMVEYGLYLLVTPHASPLSALLRHPFFSSEAVIDETAWPIYVDIQATTHRSYLSAITAAFDGRCGMAEATAAALSPSDVPSTWMGYRAVNAAEVDTAALARLRYTSLKADATASPAWIECAATHQAHTLRHLDLSAVQLPLSNIMAALGSLLQLTHVILPQHAESLTNMEAIVAALPKRLKSISVNESFMSAVYALDQSIDRQLDMVAFACHTNDVAALTA